MMCIHTYTMQWKDVYNVFLNISSILCTTWGKVCQGWGPAFSSVMEYMMPWNSGTCTSFYLKCAQYHLIAFTINIHPSFLLLNKTLILFRCSLSSMWPHASEDVDPIPSPKKTLMIGLSQAWWSHLALPGIDLSKDMWHGSGQWMWVKACWRTSGKADKKINERDSPLKMSEPRSWWHFWTIQLTNYGPILLYFFPILL